MYTLSLHDALPISIGRQDPTNPESKLLQKIMLLHGRLQEMNEMTVEDDYWFTVLPLFLERLVEHLAELGEFWVPSLIREMIAVIEGLRKS
jgi:hypothetical protein